MQKRYSPFSIKLAILAEVKKTYPGVENIKIFVSGQFAAFIK